MENHWQPSYLAIRMGELTGPPMLKQNIIKSLRSNQGINNWSILFLWTYWRGKRIIMIGLLIEIGCFVNKKKNIVSVQKAACLNKLVQGSQLYWYFPISKYSLAYPFYCHVAQGAKASTTLLTITVACTINMWWS